MVTVLVDTSASISAAEMGGFINEVRGMMRAKNWRAVKKFERGLHSPVDMAYAMGADAADRNDCRNPFPAGKRHDAFQRGYTVHKRYLQG